MAMARNAKYIYKSLLNALVKVPTPMEEDTERDMQNEFYDSNRYQPSISDVLTIKEALHKKSTLPYELIDAIVDLAEYWPHTTTSTNQGVQAGHSHENIFVLRSYPLGYQPLPTDPLDQWQIHPKHVQSYQTLQPKPWLKSRSVPNEATEEVLSKWTSKSLPRGEYPCRKIVFTIKSHDQGWGGGPGHKGTYDGSYTWFDVGMERMTACREATVEKEPEIASTHQFQLNHSIEATSQYSLPICNLQTIIPSTAKQNENDLESFIHALIPSPMVLQKNIVASRVSKEHKITWKSNDNVVPDSLDAVELEKQGRGHATADGEFVRTLKVGDVVTVWAKARFHGWTNFVQEVKMDVYWAV